MPRSFYKVSLVLAISFSATIAHAQSNIISTIAGDGTYGYTGNGGPATAATFNQPAHIVIDAAGNKYISDCNNSSIRKIDASGIITAYACGIGSGFAGDGGPATAALINAPVGLALDAAGNLYIADQNNYRIRKITPAGVISTVAGNGSSSFSGDGGAATAAGLGQVGGVAVDAAGNIYIVGMANRVRKVNTSGIIFTIAGTGIATSGGDGGPATAATVNHPWDVAVDATGNIYVSELWGNRIRKINASGIISTIAGTGVSGYTGDGGQATAAAVASPDGLALDAYGNIYFSQMAHSVVRKIAPSGIVSTIAGTGVAGYSGDGGPANLAQITTPRGLAFSNAGQLYVVDAQGWIRKFGATPTATSGSLSVTTDVTCSNIGFTIATPTYSAGMSVTTYFGDGTSVSTPVSASAITTGGYAMFNHSYLNNGTYSIKHVLMTGSTVTGTLTHYVTYKLCNTISVNFYLDGNANCIYDQSTDTHIYLPITAEIDSNGSPVDTVVTPGGFFYTAYGVPGDVYAVKVLSMPPGLSLNCPTTGVITNTVLATSSSAIATNNFGFNCSSVTGFDIRAHYTSIAGRHSYSASILVDNLYCTPQPAVMTLNMTDKYPFYSANMTPSSTTGNVVTWNFSALSSAGAPVYIQVYGEHYGTYYMPGDTTKSSYLLTPETGDMDNSNNSGFEVDTVRSSFDPNFVNVTPSGCIPAAATELQYAIGFENTGNDTAHNIYVMDTLSADLDVSSIKVISASAHMTFAKIRYGAQTILKFDFPGIMLPDSTHHDLCHGLLMYAIKTKAGLADLTNITNRAGIYFDDNEVVMTNSASNTVNCPISVAIQEMALATEVAIYPNPANSALNIVTKSATSFVIANQLGQVLQHGPINSSVMNTDISSLSPGLYFLTVNGENGNLVKKFVKM